MTDIKQQLFDAASRVERTAIDADLPEGDLKRDFAERWLAETLAILAGEEIEDAIELLESKGYVVSKA